MSDAFLQSILPPEHQPLTSKTAAAAARKNALRDRAKNKAKARASAPAAPPQKRSRAAQEAEARSSGMSRPLDQQNKGFRMLVGMGFSPGEGLGKNVRKNSGLPPPSPGCLPVASAPPLSASQPSHKCLSILACTMLGGRRQ